MRRVFITLLPVIILLGGCTAFSQSSSPGTPSVPEALTPARTMQQGFSTPDATPSVTSGPEPTPTLTIPTSTNTPMLWVAPYLPQALLDSVHNSSQEAVRFTDQINSASVHIQVSTTNVLAEWVYALVVPFPSLVDSVAAGDVIAVWKGSPSAQFPGQPLLLDENTLAIFSRLWGEPNPDLISVHPHSELLEYAWANRPAWALIPFEDLEPRWKVLEVGGQSPIRKDFDPVSYPLIAPFGLMGDLDLLTNEEIVSWRIPHSNRLDEKLTTLSLTGVTALVRGTALTMESKGITYPGIDIGGILRASDLTHINNEIPFTPDCPFPELYPTSLVFCSNPEYIGLLEDIGTDIVELSGDHFGDYGTEAMYTTLEMYAQRGWQVYGGGENADRARQPLLVEHNGNRIALLGCNIGCEIKTEISCKALAQDERPGAATCDFGWMDGRIKQLKDQGYSVVVTLQHKEYFTYTPQPDLVRDFGYPANSGAVIVSGSQAHQPHGMGFSEGAFIHYGLGNLFFDQYNYCAENACNDGFIDRHVFYDDRYISTELITIRFVDMARSRLMTPEERLNYLNKIFQASNW